MQRERFYLRHFFELDSMAKEAKYREMFNKKKMPEGYLEAPLAYDAVWAVALGKLQ